ncbi:MAG: PKD domain-containing protein, partial [bacterium]|nr:PKD domain-containing protein [bacterium]
MKSNQLFSRNALFSLIALVGLVILSSCGDDEPGTEENPPIASFGTEIDGLEVSFVNASVDATSYSWDFGDDNTSTDENPTHTYSEAGSFTVTLTATNEAGDDTFEATVQVDEPGALLTFISGKTWQLVRGDAQAIALGPAADAEVTWFSQGGPWFGLGGAGTCNGVRSSLMNDLYTFNADGTYTVDFQGDFWGEYGIWLGTDFHETNIDITGGSLPANAAGNNVDAFITGSWEYTIDETARTIATIGAGAHLINPRYKNGQSSHEVGEGITYNVYHTAEGTEADTLVIYIETFDNDFSSEPRQYMTLASYKTTDIPELCTDGFVCTDHATEVSASTVSHTFLSEDDFGSGVGSVSSSSTIDYGVEIGGETCTRYTRTDADGGFTDFKINADVNDIRFDSD